jgi:hypothetical protein
MIFWGLLLPLMSFSVEWSGPLPDAHQESDETQSCSIDPVAEPCSQPGSVVDPETEHWTLEGDDRGWVRVSGNLRHFRCKSQRRGPGNL